MAGTKNTPKNQTGRNKTANNSNSNDNGTNGNGINNNNGNNSGRGRGRGRGRGGGGGGNSKHGEEQHSFDESLTPSQEDALLNTPPMHSTQIPHLFTPSRNDSGYLELLEIINGLKGKITSIEISFNDFKEQKNAEITELQNKIRKLEAEKEDTQTTPALTELSAIKSTIKTLEESQDLLQQDRVKNVCVLSGNGIPESTEDESCTDAVAQIIEQKLKIKLTPNTITEAYRLGDKKAGHRDKRPIRFKINDNTTKSKLIAACVKVKPVDLFLNEFLVPSKKKLLERALKIRKDHRQILHSCYFKNGILNIKKSVNSEPIKIKNESELNTYLASVNLSPAI